MPREVSLSTRGIRVSERRTVGRGIISQSHRVAHSCRPVISRSCAFRCELSRPWNIGYIIHHPRAVTFAETDGVPTTTTARRRVT